MAEPILIAQGAQPQQEIHLLPRMANRHGLIAGATGTGKTVTLQSLAHSFSRLGVPVFMADVKGDLAGISRPGGDNARVAERVRILGLEPFPYEGCPVAFWDVFGEAGHPLRTTVSEMGPLLLARLLNLNDTQAGVLSIAFRLADDEGLLLLDLKDLRLLVQFVGENAASLTTAYGNVSAASVGAIQRALLTLEEQGAEHFFGEPALDLDDLIQTVDGRGVVNILAADRLLQSPKLYSTFLLWLLAELFEQLPEVGDLDRPKLVFFFDEAHLLFADAPKALQEKIEQVVRLIRSKGVGVYFVSQNPLDIPDIVLGQLGNRIQHALRAFTPRDQKAVRAAAETFRANPKLDVAAAITELGVGEALVSMLDDGGRPGIVERAFVVPPGSRLGPITPEQRQEVLRASLLYGHYEKQVDRESAYEILRDRADQAARAQEDAAAQAVAEKEAALARKQAEKEEAAARRQAEREAAARARQQAAATRQAGAVMSSFARSAARSVGGGLGRELVRGILGGLFGGGATRRGRR